MRTALDNAAERISSFPVRAKRQLLIVAMNRKLNNEHTRNLMKKNSQKVEINEMRTVTKANRSQTKKRESEKTLIMVSHSCPCNNS
ncbi:MAG: hypothetical protein PVH19_01160 [Planctomycetia bacterium]